MASKEDLSLWTKKGATLTDKSAQKEYGLTQAEIVQAIQSGKLEYRLNSLYGNPCFKLLRPQVEAFLIEKYGPEHLKSQQIQTELNTVTTEIRALKRKISQLEKRKEELLAMQVRIVSSPLKVVEQAPPDDPLSLAEINDIVHERRRPLEKQ